MFAPMMLPTDRDDCFLRMAVMVVTSSGSEVPMAIMVAPMMASGTPSICASAVPLSISSCAPSTMAAAPNTNLPILSATVRPSVLGRASCSGASSDCSRRAATRLSAIKHTKMTRIKTLSRMDNCPSRVKPNRTAIAASSSTALTAYCRRGMVHSMQMSDRHMIRPVLAVTEPTALPMAMSALPSSAEKTDTSISGIVVAKLTTVAPMMNFGIPEASAIHVAASTKKSPPLMMHTRPAANSSRTRKRVLPVKSRFITHSPS